MRRVDRARICIRVAGHRELAHREAARSQPDRRRIEDALVRDGGEPTTALDREPGPARKLVDAADDPIRERFGRARRPRI